MKHFKTNKRNPVEGPKGEVLYENSQIFGHQTGPLYQFIEGKPVTYNFVPKISQTLSHSLVSIKLYIRVLASGLEQLHMLQS